MCYNYSMKKKQSKEYWHAVYMQRKKREMARDPEGYRRRGREYARKWWASHPEEAKSIRQKYYCARREKQLLQRQEIKKEVLTFYGNGTYACVHCGESHPACLTLDHINSDGAAQRKELKLRGVSFYQWLQRKGFPVGYQTLCMNCQFKKREELKEHNAVTLQSQERS